MTEYHIYARDENKDWIGEIDQFNAMTMVLRFNAVGTWTQDSIDSLVIPPRGGVIVNRNGVDILSGPVAEREKSLKQNRYGYGYGGYDDLLYLSDRIAYPVPSGPPYSSQAYDVQTGACETVLKYYVNYNAGPLASGNRRVPGLTIEPDTAIGSTVTGRARFHPLLLTLQNLALAGGDIGFRVLNMAFGVYQPVDRRASVVFSTELGNLADYTYRTTRAKVNYVIAGGGGTGTSRTFVELGDSASIVTHGRVEQFKDCRNTTVAAELTQNILEELQTGAELFVLSFTPVNNLPKMQYGIDYNLGDWITVVIEGTAITGIVREVKITLDKNGEKIEPVIATPGVSAGLLQKTFSRLDGLTRRLDNLEVVN